MAKFIDEIKKGDVNQKSLLWEFIIYSEIFFQAKFKSVIKSTPKTKPLHDTLTKLYGIHKISDQNQDKEWFDRLLDLGTKVLRSISLQAPVAYATIELDLSKVFDRKDVEFSPERFVYRMRELLSDLMPESISFRVLIDELDDYWRSSPEEREVIVALLYAVDRIHSTFAQSQISVTVFLRTDIWDVLEFSMKPSFNNKMLRINWNRDLLVDFIAKRIEFNVGKSLEPTRAWECICDTSANSPFTKFNYMINRTFLRPRDVLWFVRNALRQSILRGTKLIDANCIKHGEKGFSREIYDSLMTEYGSNYPFFRALIDGFSGRDALLRKSEVQDVITQVRGTQSLAISPAIYTNRWFFQNLFEWGVLGTASSSGSEPKYYYDDLIVNVHGSKYFNVHRSLWPVLGVTQKRTPGGRSPDTKNAKAS